MTLRSEYSLGRSAYNDFLHAPLGHDAAGTEFTVLSALTRLGSGCTSGHGVCGISGVLPLGRESTKRKATAAASDSVQVPPRPTPGRQAMAAASA